MLGLEEAKITASETLSKWKKRALACTGEAILGNTLLCATNNSTDIYPDG
jgi:hypothetical protein